MSQSQRKRMTAQELLTRYAIGERDFSNIYIRDYGGDFTNVDLSGINLEGSYLAVKLNRVNFTGANLQNTTWEVVTWKEVNLSGSDLTGFVNQESCFFRECNLTNSIWSYADLFQVHFRNCKTEGAIWYETSFTETDFLAE